MLKGHTKHYLLACLVSWFLFCLIGAPVYADTSINVSLDSDAVVLDLLPNNANGKFAKSSSLTIDVSISGPGGYTIGVSSDGSTDLVKQGDNTKKFESITTAISESDFSANNATAGENYNMKWGYLPSKFDSLANSLYRPAPDAQGDILDVTHGTNDEGEYEIAIGARASLEAVAGAYANTFVITAVSNYSCSVGEICYYDNGADGGVMENQNIGVGDTEKMLAGGNYYRAGYGFAGWSPTMLDPDDVNFASDFANATVYGPMETVEIPAAGYLGLYAVWVPSSGNMQSWSGCDAMSTGEVIGLTDTRDGNVYAVAKLDGGTCWQIENLRLDFSDENVEITNMNTNHPTAQFVSDANQHPEPARTFGTRINRFDRDIKYKGVDNYAFGYYYNWQTLRGGNGWIEDFGSEVPNGDICATGWRVPTQSQWSNFALSLTPEQLRAYPQNVILSGYYGEQRLYSANSEVFYTGNKTSNYFGSEYENFQGFGIWNSSNGPKVFVASFSGVDSYDGLNVRCVVGSSVNYALTYDANGGADAPASEIINSTSGVFEDITADEPVRSGYNFVGWIDKDGFEVQPGGDYNAGVDNTGARLYAIWDNNSCNKSAITIGTGNPTDAVCMQDINESVKNAMATANSSAGSIQTFQLLDARDNENYSVALLDDGNVWMTKDLNLGRNSTMALSHYDTNFLDTQSLILTASNTASNYTNGENGDGYYDGVYYGGYYDWYVVTGTKNNVSGTVNRTTSICPLGWTLPTLTQYNNLKSAASLTNYATASVSPYNFNNSGYVEFGGNSYRQYYYRGGRGFYWTSTIVSSSARVAYLDSSSFSSIGQAAHYGSNVRCVATNGVVTINYNGNGNSAHPATGSMPTQVVNINTGNVLGNSFAREGYVFKGWNTRADGSGDDVAVGDELYLMDISDGDEFTLYAQWAPQVIITYHDNNNGVTRTVNVEAGSSTTLGSYEYYTNKEGYTIKEWNTEPDGTGISYAVSSTYSVPADLGEPMYLTLYAQWVEDCLVTYVNTETGETQTKRIKWNQSGSVNPPTAWTDNSYKVSGWDLVPNSGVGSGGSVVYALNSSIVLTSDLTLYTVWTPIYRIQFDGNGASGSTTMAVNYEVEGGEDINLYASNYTNTGYGFVGWSFDSNAASNLANATVYGPNATITTPVLTTPGEIKKLYAVWVKAEDGVTMQTFDGNVSPYDSAAIGTVIALTDSRDNDTYAVAKLADEKWWMIENLRLGDTSSVALNMNTSAVSYDVSLPASIASFSTNYYDMMQVNTDNKTSTVAVMENNYSKTYSYGSYYSWNAAIGSSTIVATNNYSICPYGWRLPSGDSSSGDFNGLKVALVGIGSSAVGEAGIVASKAFRAFPNNFVYSGRKNGSPGLTGYYWSNYANSGNNYREARALYFTSNTVYPTTAYYKYYGSTVRCIAD